MSHCSDDWSKHTPALQCMLTITNKFLNDFRTSFYIFPYHSWLTAQYRMNEEIMEVCNHLVYESRMSCAKAEIAVRRLVLPRIVDLPLPLTMNAKTGSMEGNLALQRTDWLYRAVMPKFPVVCTLCVYVICYWALTMHTGILLGISKYGWLAKRFIVVSIVIRFIPSKYKQSRRSQDCRNSVVGFESCRLPSAGILNKHTLVRIHTT